ncbi:MAG: DUF1566 domain-containing protein [Gammaproteobacteria bacterium]|nr:DUF1566 domain-containing protein [Gammaproteobacteria bacterium]
MKRSYARCIIISLLALPCAGFAGNLNSPAGPTVAASAMYTLKDICDRLDTGAAGSKRAGVFTEPGAGPGATGCSLDDAMSKAPAEDNADGAVPAEVLTGKTFWGLQGGNWGLLTGSLPAQTLSDANDTVTAGNYAATTLSTVDSDLAAGNIKSGVTIFGVAGSFSGSSTATVHKTGQTFCYDPSTADVQDCAGTGQDGEYAGAYGASASPRFTDNGDGTVTDNLTGLIWLGNANCAAAGRTWALALTDVDQLNTDGTMNSNNCGDTSNQTDWRLPNGNELASLVNKAFYAPALSNAAGTDQWTEGNPFSGVQASGYWSSTTVSSRTGSAWVVILSYGFVGHTYKTDSDYVWPVRGGQ